MSRCLAPTVRRSRVLEVGCGPGHNSLELARLGHHVTGVDLSPTCIEVAIKTLENNTHREGFGSLTYFHGNLLEVDIPGGPFNATFFYGALSHFPEIDLVLDKVCDLLTASGRILLYDTGVDVYTKQDASIRYLIETLLSSTGCYSKSEPLPTTKGQLDTLVDNALAHLQYLDDTGNNVQSPNDNAQTYGTMMPAQGRRLRQLLFAPESCFFRNVVGASGSSSARMTTRWRRSSSFSIATSPSRIS